MFFIVYMLNKLSNKISMNWNIVHVHVHTNLMKIILHSIFRLQKLISFVFIDPLWNCITEIKKDSFKYFMATLKVLLRHIFNK